MNALKALFCGKTWRGSLVRVLLLLTLCTIPFWYHYKAVWIDGISMTPTYKDGQWTLMQRTRSLGAGWIPDRFDVIAVWSDKDQELLCKRVIGLPGETVELIEGRIFIDGTKLSDSFGRGNMVYQNFIDIETNKSWLKKYENVPSTVIAKDSVWVVGDHREESLFGHFPIKEIRGKIILY